MMSRLIALAAALVLAACSSNKEPAGKPAEPAAAFPPGPVNAKGEQVTDPARARELAAQGAPVLDVRTQEEWDAGHLDKAKLIPVADFQGRLAEVEALVGGDKSKPVVVVCRSGGRAEKAKAMLLTAGYTNVVNGGRWENLQ